MATAFDMLLPGTGHAERSINLARHAVERLATVVSVDKLVFAVDAAGERYLLETPLAELEAALDPQRFFRANRQVVLAADAVARFAPAGKGRLRVELRPPGASAVIVSQERAAAFRAWLAG